MNGAAAGPFVHLRVRSAFSPLEGAMRIPELIELCRRDGSPAVGVADSGNLFGALEFSVALSSAGIQPVVGCAVGFRALPRAPARRSEGPPPQIVLIAQDERGYRNLLGVVSDSYVKAAGAAPMVSADDLRDRSEGLVCLTGGAFGPVGALLRDGRRDAALDVVDDLRELFPGRCYVEVQRHGVDGAKRTEAERLTEPLFVEFAHDRGLPLVATNDVQFPDPDFHDTHRLLRMIAGDLTDEQYDARTTRVHCFRAADEMRILFSDLPEAVDNALDIARRVSFCPGLRQPALPRLADDEVKELRSKSEAGLAARLRTSEASDSEPAYRERLDYELGVIERMEYAGYFLIVADFVGWARRNGVPVGPGRGSGAGSLAAYALGITDLDPIRYGLMFERFLNPERVSMPDFDIDFCELTAETRCMELRAHPLRGRARREDRHLQHPPGARGAARHGSGQWAWRAPRPSRIANTGSRTTPPDPTTLAARARRSLKEFRAAIAADRGRRTGCSGLAVQDRGAASETRPSTRPASSSATAR